MGFSLIGGSCLEVEVANPSILKTEHSPRHPLQLDRLPRPTTGSSLRAAPSRGSGFVLWPSPDSVPVLNTKLQYCPASWRRPCASQRSRPRARWRRWGHGRRPLPFSSESRTS